MITDIRRSQLYDGDSPDFFEKREVRKSRKSFTCSECENDIPAGSSYERVIAKFKEMSSLVTYRTCQNCVFVRDNLLKEDWYPAGNCELWDLILLGKVCRIDEISEIYLSKTAGKLRDKLFALIEDEWAKQEEFCVFAGIET
jgi:hypothetical protein